MLNYATIMLNYAKGARVRFVGSAADRPTFFCFRFVAVSGLFFFGVGGALGTGLGFALCFYVV